VNVRNGPTDRPTTDAGRRFRGPRERSDRIEPGHGLRGMRERAAMLDGELTAGPAPDGGFEVHAVLPLNEGDR
jgi:signal transduction histidine kinase